MSRTFKILLLATAFIIIALSLLFCGTSADTASQGKHPQVKLAVVMVVDQMRADYLSRWSNLYTGGLHRLLENGAIFTNAYHDHAATMTAVGHSTISTGTVPAKHGIVGNSFYSRKLDDVVSSVVDDSTKLLGGEGGVGASPHRLLRSTIGDWLKKASPKSKVFTASLKDRAAILMGGKNPDGAFWYDDRDGNFVSSSYYFDTLPAWVISFNNSGAKDTWQDSLWMASGKTIDANVKTANEKSSDTTTAFSHALNDEKKSNEYYENIYDSPFADALLLEFGLDLLASEHLGEDTIPDLFMISLSAADHVGHEFGPDSREIMDYYFRLDSELGMFLDSLDARYGRDGYVLVLSSDHGVCPIPEVASENGQTNFHRLLAKDYRNDVAGILRSTFPDCEHLADLLHPVYNGFLIDSTAAAKCGMSKATVETKLAGALERLDYVADAFTYNQLEAKNAEDIPYLPLFRNSFYPDRSVDMMVNFKDGVLLTSSTGGTSHGTPYRYDTHVPIVFYGEDIRHMTDSDSVRTVDIAPTLAELLNITPETGIDGQVLPVGE